MPEMRYGASQNRLVSLPVHSQPKVCFTPVLLTAHDRSGLVCVNPLQAKQEVGYLLTLITIANAGQPENGLET